MVIASIDLMGSKVVQLRQGKEKIIEKNNSIPLAVEFNKYGEIAVIDLDAAMGKGDNLKTIKKILKHGECRVGGGIRNTDKARELISFGASKIIIGSRTFDNDKINHNFLKELVAKIDNNRIMIAIDALNREIVTNGWRHKTGLKLFGVVEDLKEYNLNFLFTCVEREGTMEGIDLETVRELKHRIGKKFTVAGGIGSIEEIKELAGLNLDVQLGMVIYTDKIDLTEAFIESLNWKQDLIPTITQDQTGQILTLAFSNRESLSSTFKTNRVWYFSRSRNRLWMKGETSGNIQEFIKVRADCDQDALLITAKPKGPACHLGGYSCFGDKRFSLHELYDVIEGRLRNPKKGSYTASLTDDLLKQKIIEEAKELIEAEEKDDVIWEAADLLYFILVRLATEKVGLEDVLFELQRRRRR